MVWVKLKSSSLTIYFQISEYKKANNWEDWVIVNLRIIGNGINIKYGLNSLFANEVDEISDEIEKLLTKDHYFNEYIPLEEDFVFTFNGKKDKCLQIKYYLDDQERNFLLINLRGKDLNYLRTYLLLITKKISTENPVVIEYLNNGIFQGT